MRRPRHGVRSFKKRPLFSNGAGFFVASDGRLHPVPQTWQPNSLIVFSLQSKNLPPSLRTQDVGQHFLGKEEVAVGSALPLVLTLQYINQ